MACYFLTYSSQLCYQNEEAWIWLDQYGRGKKCWQSHVGDAEEKSESRILDGCGQCRLSPEARILGTRTVFREGNLTSGQIYDEVADN